MTVLRPLLFLALLVATFGATAAPPAWTVTELPGIGPFGGSARSVNNRGDVAGTVHFAEFSPHPAHWANGRVTDLLPGSAQTGIANAINDKGLVAGTNGTHVTLWQDGVAIALGIAGEPQDVNKFGAVVGFYYPSGQYAFGPQRGFFYRDGVLHDIGTLGNNVTGANGVNDRGVVVGHSRLPFSSDSHAIVWENGVLRDLGTLGGANSIAVDVNNRGVVLGWAEPAQGPPHLVTWDTDGRLLRDFGPGLSGHALNDRGHIVGNHSDGRPFLLDDGVFTWLLELPAMKAGGWVSFAPFDINERGWIVGVAWKPGMPNAGVPLLLQPR